MISKLIFTAGVDGQIRVWNIPQFQKEDKYPTTGGRNFCVGLWNDGVKEPYWNIDYHHFSPLLVAVKANSKVQVWNCDDIVEKAEAYDFSDEKKCQEDFDKNDKPMKEFELQVNDKVQNATCARWLATDSDMFAVGYESSHIAFFNYKTGKVVHSALLDESENASPVTCMVAHEY